MNLKIYLLAFSGMIVFCSGFGLKTPLTIVNPVDSTKEAFLKLSLARHVNLSEISILPWKVIKVLSQNQMDNSCIESAKEFVLDVENLQPDALQSKHKCKFTM